MEAQVTGSSLCLCHHFDLKCWNTDTFKVVDVNAFSSWKITFETYCLHLKIAQCKKGFERNKIDQHFHYNTEKSSIHLLNFVFNGELSPLYINIYIFGMKQDPCNDLQIAIEESQLWWINIDK